jgi:hypothetical protein
MEKLQFEKKEGTAPRVDLDLQTVAEILNKSVLSVVILMFSQKY